MIARRLLDRSMSSWLAPLLGKKLMMRSMVWLALFACSVPRHRCPVSANAIACSMVSVSRISPIRITSGACRKVFLSALCQECVSMPTSRCVISDCCELVHELDRVLDRDDVPALEERLRWSIIAASEVDLPEPVAPTTSTRPRLVMTISLSVSGKPSVSKFGNLVGDGADHHADVLLLHEDVDAEARHAGQRNREVAFQIASRTPRAGARS
jgi:hypothetical protein